MYSVRSFLVTLIVRNRSWFNCSHFKLYILLQSLIELSSNSSFYYEKFIFWINGTSTTFLGGEILFISISKAHMKK